MKKLGVLVFIIQGLNAQTSPCDVNKDGAVNIADVQMMVNEALGVLTCSSDLDGSGKCDIADVQRVITAALGGTCNATGPSTASTIQLPVEVIGLDGTTKTVSFNIPSGSNLSGTLRLALQIHGLHYQTQASVQVNSSAWMPINNTTVTLLGLANAYGGIGGGFHTFQLTMNLPSGAVTAGTNTINFKFNGTDGRVSGFRILGFNVEDANGNALVSSSAFTWEDPNTWRPPSTQAADIAAGKTLWSTAPLTIPTSSGTQSILAHCSDCHAQDGRDLKYFNYSNNSIHTRSMFHGLTAQQGDQIASYVRSLNVPNPGRPWNPPYQPGPSLDSLPVTDWSAGAGLSAVLQDDADMLPYLMPAGSTANWAATTSLSAREVPITMQMPDWNMWLPSVHPVDAWGNSFLSNIVYTNYETIRAGLVANDPTSYSRQKLNIWTWQLYYVNFHNSVLKVQTDPAWKTPQYLNSIISLGMWAMVKNWEINQEFGLEGMAQTAFGSQADSRAWYSPLPFFVSPGMEGVPPGVIGNGSDAALNYMAQIWYQVQLILNAGNNRGTGIPTGSTADFPYVYDHIDGFTWFIKPNSPQSLLEAEWLIKALQGSEFGAGPEKGNFGWSPNYNDPHRLVEQAVTKWSSKMSPTDRTNVMQAYLQLWFNKVSSFTPQQFYTGNWATATQIPDPTNPDIRGNGTAGFANTTAFMIPRFIHLGVSSTLTDQIIAWAKKMWPNYTKWDAMKNAVCNPGTYEVNCTW
ncbi:MAG: hypothetical protein LAP39_12620 [Acidobacteriia bacterium]|nr:hypothetical protein [Terriglobia bacterium]